MNFNERLRYLIDCEEIKLKDLAPKLCLSASTLSNYTQGIREPDVALQKKRKNVAVKMKKERRLRSCLNTS